MSNTVVVIIVLAVLLIGFMIWQNSKAQQSQNQLIGDLVANQNSQNEANIWSSMGDWSNIIGGVGGLFGSGNNNDNGETYVNDEGSRIITTSPVNPPYPPSTQTYATDGFNNLRSMVDYGYGIQLNG